MKFRKKNIWIKSNTGEFININNITYISSLIYNNTNKYLYFELRTNTNRSYAFYSKRKNDIHNDIHIKEFKNAYNIICDLIINKKYGDNMYYPFNNK